MASTTETGHAVNIANFKKIIDRCGEFGTRYHPENAALELATMTTQWENAAEAHTTYLEKWGDTRVPINDRENLFEGLDIVVGRSYNIYKSTEATARNKQDAKALAQKIRGINVVVRKLEDGTPDPKYVSTSHQSFIKKIENFTNLVHLYKTDSTYATNETDLTTASLDSLLATMKLTNDAVEGLIAIAIGYRNERDHLLYDDKRGIVDVVQKCKSYVKGVYGGISPEAKSVVGIILRRFMRLKPV